MLPSTPRPLFAAVASGLSVVAAIAVAGVAALAALETGLDLRAPDDDRRTAVLSLADVPRPDVPRPDVQGLEHDAVHAPPRTRPIVGDATNRRTAHRGRAPRERRNRPTSPRRGRAGAERAPRSQRPAAATAPAVAGGTSVASVAEPRSVRKKASRAFPKQTTASPRRAATPPARRHEPKPPASAKNVRPRGKPAGPAEARPPSAAPQSAPAHGPPAHARGPEMREHPHGENRGHGPHR